MEIWEFQKQRHFLCLMVNYVDFENEDFHSTRRKYMHYNYNNIDIYMDNFENGKFASGDILSSINTCPDLIIFGLKIGKYNFITIYGNNVLFNQINCPFMISIDYDLSGVGFMRSSFEKIGLAGLVEFSISKLFKIYFFEMMGIDKLDKKQSWVIVAP